MRENEDGADRTPDTNAGCARSIRHLAVELRTNVTLRVQKGEGMAEDQVDAGTSGAQNAPYTNRPAYGAFQKSTILEKYGQVKSNALLLFYAQFKLGIDDLDAFASNYLTDHSNDKKCDLVAISPLGNTLIIAQGYLNEKENKTEANAGKASELNTGVSWILSGPLDGVPDVLRSAATEAREAVRSEQIQELQIWFVHNCPESDNVKIELQQAVTTANSILRTQFPDVNIDVTAKEIGRATLEHEYKSSKVPILVKEEISFDIPGGFETSTGEWTVYSTAIPAATLRQLWLKHGTKLLSPNVRDYLGSTRAKGNINHGIKQTAVQEPENFAVFNNGITVLVHEYEVCTSGEQAEQSNESPKLVVNGFGIVNGGQTTGAVGALPDEDGARLANAQVMARFVKCSNATVLEKIVRYNNTQNKIEAMDFRSNDPVQESLRNKFQTIPDAEYRGGRRGGATDAIERKGNLLLADKTVAQALASFHGNPNLAYNETRKIWENDKHYSEVFRQDLTAEHVVFTYSLLKAADTKKKELLDTPTEKRTQSQKNHIAFLRTRGSTNLLTTAVGACMETILGQPISNSFELRFKDNVPPNVAIDRWATVVNIALALSTHLKSATDLGMKDQAKVNSAIDTFTAQLEVSLAANENLFEEFAGLVSAA